MLSFRVMLPPHLHPDGCDRCGEAQPALWSVGRRPLERPQQDRRRCSRIPSARAWKSAWCSCRKGTAARVGLCQIGDASKVRVIQLDAF